jgi:hypothetical protein
MFDREQGPLWSVQLLETDGHLYLSLATDHLIFDGLSQQLFLEELFAALNGASRIEGEARSYGEFVLWQQEYWSSRWPEESKYWTTELADSKGPSRLSSSEDPSRPLDGHIDTVGCSLTAEELAALRSFAASARVSLFMVVAAVTSRLVSALTGGSDISIQVQVAARPLGFERTIGWFSNDVVLRVRDADQSLLRVLSAVRQKWLEVLEYQYAPFEAVLRKVEQLEHIKDYRPTVLSLNAQDRLVSTTVKGAALEEVPVRKYFPIQGLDIVAVTHPGGLDLRFGFDAGRDDHSNIESLANEFRETLMGLVATTSR